MHIFGANGSITILPTIKIIKMLKRVFTKTFYPQVSSIFQVPKSVAAFSKVAQLATNAQ